MRTFLLLCIAPLLLAADSDWQSEGIVSVTHSPHAKLHAVPIHAVKMGDGFWSARRAINVEKSIPTMLAELEQHGVVDNFLRLEGKKDVPRRGPLRRPPRDQRGEEHPYHARGTGAARRGR